MNSISVIGRLGGDPELNFVGEDETPLTKFSVAQDAGYGTNWFNVEAWGSLGETIAEHFTKGDGIYLEGSMEQDEWTDDEGNTRKSWTFRAGTFTFLPSSDASAPSGGDDFEDPEDDDDLPF